MGRSKLGVLLGAPMLLLLLSWGVAGFGPASAGTSSPDAFFYLSSTTAGSVAGISFDDEDVIVYDSVADTWQLVFDGSDVLPASADVNGFALNDDGSMLLSFQANVTISGLGTVDDSDVVMFTPTSTGDDTAGVFSMALDGSTVGLTTSNEEITALVGPQDAGSELVVSTAGGFSVPQTRGGNLTGTDDDLISLDAGTWDLRFDGSDVALGAEDLWGAWLDRDTGEVYGASLNGFSVPGLAGDGDDVFAFTGVTGEATSGTFATVFDGDAHGFGGEQIDALHLELQTPPPPGDADLSISKTDDVDPVLPGDLVTYTVAVANAGPDPAENVVVTDVLPAEVTLAATTGCAQDPTGLVCSLGTIPVGATAQYTIAVIIDAGTAGTITNMATVTAGTADPNPNNNMADEDTLVGSVPMATDDGPATNSMIGDPYHTATDTALAAIAPGLLGNDMVGDPAAQIVSFGGGDAGGDVTTNAAGATVAVGDGSVTINADGGFSFDPPTGFEGVFTVDYRLANVLGQSDATLAVFVGERLEVAGGDLIYLSSTSFGTVDGIDFHDEDVLVFDNELDTWEMFFDGTDVLPAGADVNAFHILPDGDLLMSFQNPVTIAGLGTIDDSDVVRFNPTTLGQDTTGFFTLELDGTGFGLTTSAEDISALTFHQGDLTVSTAGSFNVPLTAGGNQLGRNEDLIKTTAPGTWELLFDGSLVDLAAEDLAGASYDEESQAVYATSFNGYNVPGLSGDNNDVIVFSGTLGPATAGTFSTFFDGDSHRFGDEQLDALHVVLNRNRPPMARPDRAYAQEGRILSVTANAPAQNLVSLGMNEPRAVAVDPANGNIVIADTGNGRVVVFDSAGVATGVEITGLNDPAGVAVDPASGNIVVTDTVNGRVVVFDSAGVPTGVTVTGLSQPRGVAVDPLTGNLIISDSGNDRVLVYTPAGVWTGVEITGLVSPGGVAVDPFSGDILVADTFNNRIASFDQAGSLTGELTGLSTPFDVDVNPVSGDLIVTNTFAGQVVVFDRAGTPTGVEITGLTSPFGVAIDPTTGNIVVADPPADLVAVFDGSGVATGLQFSKVQSPEALTFDPTTGNIVLADAGADKVVILDPLGVPMDVVVTGLAEPSGIAVDPATGNFVVSDSFNDRVVVFDGAGTPTGVQMTGLDYPGGLVVDPATGDIIVADDGNNRVVGFDGAGNPTGFEITGLTNPRDVAHDPVTGNFVVAEPSTGRVAVFDSTGAPTGVAITGLSQPRGVAVDPLSGNIVVADSGNDRIVVFDRSGAPTGTVIGAPLTDLGFPGDVDLDPITANIVVADTAHDRVLLLDAGVLDNDVDPDGDVLIVSASDSTSALGAVVAVAADGSYTYDPTGVAVIEALNAGATLTDTFGYTTTDGNGETDSEIVTITVVGADEPNAAPTISSANAVAVAENQTGVIDVAATDDSDAEGTGNGLLFLLGGVDAEWFSIDDDGVITFDQAPDFEMPDDANGDSVYQLRVLVTDSGGQQAIQPLTVTVSDVFDNATITIVQDTQPDDPTDFSFTGELGSFQLDDEGGSDNTLPKTRTVVVSAGIISVFQEPDNSFGLAGIECTGASRVQTNLGAGQLDVTVATGESAICTFINQPIIDAAVDLDNFGSTAGEEITLRVRAISPVPLPDPILRLNVGSAITIDSFPGNCTQDGSLVTCPSTSFDVVGTIRPTVTGTIVALANLGVNGYVDPNPSNNSFILQIQVIFEPPG